MPSLGQQERVYVGITDKFSGITTELPAFVCSHCQRTVIQNPDRTRPRAVCRKCDHLVCDTCSRVDGECLSIRQDVDRAFEDKWKQPWMLRDQGDRGSRILDKDGNPILVKQKDVGYTDRQMEAVAGSLNYDGSSKWQKGEQIL